MIHLWASPEINNPKFYHYALVNELSRALLVKPRAPVGYDEGVHVTVVLARWLFENQSWFRGLKGTRVIVEHDAYLNFMPDSPYHKSWTRLYRNCNFDLIVSSGKETTNRLREEGLPALWVPKGCNREFLDVRNEFTGEIGYFGSPVAEQETGRKFHFYKSRHDMSSTLEGKMPAIACTPQEFPETVKRYSAAVTDDSTMKEPMAKHFECSAMGCAMIRDRQEELVDLGYRDNVSVAFYDDHNHMLDVVEYYRKNPDHLRELQYNAAEVAKDHTWGHRARQILEVVKPYFKNRMLC